MNKYFNPWKIIAIIFIILFVLETMFLIWLLSIGSQSVRNETDCSRNICRNTEGVTNYYYDLYEKICYCLNSEGETVKQEFIK